jgi:hypothetical protein
MNIYLNCGWKKAAIELLSLFKKRRVWYSKSRSHLGKLQSHRRSCFSAPQFKSASYFSGPSQKANAPLIVPLTVADKAIALV